MGDFGLPAALTSSMDGCAHWLAVQPSADSCQQAAIFEAAGDTSIALGALGVIGVLVLAVVFLLRRSGAFRPAVIPPTLAPAIATTVFSVAAVGLFICGAVNAVIGQTWGRGMWFSESACAVIAAVISGILLVRVIDRPFGGAIA